MNRRITFYFSLLAFTVLPFVISAQKLAPLPYVDSIWTVPYKPFRIAGSLYYVGTYDLASYVIKTSKGLILINTGLAESVPVLKKNIEELGFKFADIKILLTNQAHYDHVAGMAEIKKATGAKMMVQEGDVQVLTDGGSSDYAFGDNGATFKSVKVDRVLHDGDVVELGDTRLDVLHHPGHTKGATSFILNTKDEVRSWKVLIVNIPSILSAARIYGMPRYPKIGDDYKKTLASLKTIQFDIWVAAHASQFKLHEVRKEGAPYRPEAFADKKAFNESISWIQNAYDQRLIDEKRN